MNDANFKVRDPDYVERVHRSLREQPFMDTLLRASAVRVAPGHVDVALEVTADMRQPWGNVHGVVATALADSATGYAAQTLLAPAFDIVTVEYKMNFLAPGVGTRLVAEGRVMRPGRTLTVSAADVYAEEGDSRVHFAHMVATLMAVQR